MARILLTVPAWNEAAVLERNLLTLHDACGSAFATHEWLIEVADNGSTDETPKIVTRLALYLDRLRLRVLSERGKGRAIRASWRGGQRDFDAFVFLDADLAADLAALPRLIKPVLDGQADLVIGSRFDPSARVERSWLRSRLSHVYRRWQRLVLGLRVLDAQCGFKAVSARVVEDVLPLTRETHWLFDTELLALAEQRGFTVREIPVSWIERRSPLRRSALTVWRDGWGFVFGVWRIRQRLGRKLSTAGH